MEKSRRRRRATKTKSEVTTALHCSPFYPIIIKACAVIFLINFHTFTHSNKQKMNGASSSSAKSITTWDILMYKVAKALQDMQAITIDNVATPRQSRLTCFGPALVSCQYSVSLKNMPSSVHGKSTSLLAFDRMRSEMTELRETLLPLAPSCFIDVTVNDDKNPSQYQTPRSHEFLMPTAVVKVGMKQSEMQTYNINGPSGGSGGKQKQQDVSEVIEDIVSDAAPLDKKSSVTATTLNSAPAFDWKMLLKLVALCLLLVFCIFQLENLLIVYNYVHTHEAEELLKQEL